jgi:hypothetical protein
MAGEVVDRSRGGLAVVVAEQARVGERLRVRPATEPDVPWAEVEVRHGRPGAGGWLLGCRFAVAPPPAAVATLARSCGVLQLPLEMPKWFRAFATARLADLCPTSIPIIERMADSDLRQFYAAVRMTGEAGCLD